MYNISKNPGQLLNLLFNTLDRKSVTNKEVRIKFKDQLLTYYSFIIRVSNLEINDLLFSSQLKYFSYLDTILQRYMNIGDEVIPESRLDEFLSKLQTNMLEYCDIQNELQNKLYQIEKEYYSKLAFDKDYNNGTRSDRRTEELKSSAVDVLKYGKNKYVTFD
jgi:hypothetical protein